MMLSGLILDDGLVEEHCRAQDLKCTETTIDGSFIKDPPLRKLDFFKALVAKIFLTKNGNLTLYEYNTLLALWNTANLFYAAKQILSDFALKDFLNNKTFFLFHNAAYSLFFNKNFSKYHFFKLKSVS